LAPFLFGWGRGGTGRGGWGGGGLRGANPKKYTCHKKYPPGVSQETSVIKKFGCPSAPTQLHTANYCPINYATASSKMWSGTAVEEKRPKCSMDFSLIACLQVVQPLLTEAQGLPFVAAAGLHGAAARACFCCCWLLLYRNEPIFHTLPIPAAVPAL